MLKANTTELHPKVRPTCSLLYLYFVLYFARYLLTIFCTVYFLPFHPTKWSTLHEPQIPASSTVHPIRSFYILDIWKRRRLEFGDSSYLSSHNTHLLLHCCHFRWNNILYSRSDTILPIFMYVVYLIQIYLSIICP